MTRLPRSVTLHTTVAVSYLLAILGIASAWGLIEALAASLTACSFFTSNPEYIVT